MQIGDMFIVVNAQPCCGADSGVGNVGEIIAFHSKGGPCRVCGAIPDEPGVVFMFGGVPSWVRMSRIRILPPDIDVAETWRGEIA